MRDDGTWQRAEVPRMGDLLPKGVQLVARHGVTIICAIQTLSGISGRSGTNQLLSLALLAVLAVVWAIVATRRTGDWLDITALMIAIGVGAWLHVLTNHGQAFITGYGAVFVAPFWYRLPISLLPWMAGVTSVTLSTMFVGERDITGGFGNGAGAMFFGLAALFWGRVLRSSQANARLVAELRESRDAEQRNAVVAERARLARELHDVLAHTLSSLALHLESTRVLATSRAVDAEVVERIARAVALARTGLEEARSAVGALRDDELPGPERLTSLIADFERVSGIDVDFESSGPPADLSTEARVALFRTAQEALTNVSKHANADRVVVGLQWSEAEVVLRILDNGSGPAGVSLPSGGNGLRGMRERAKLAGGHLIAERTSDGFAVTLFLPALASEPVEPAVEPTQPVTPVG